MFNLASKISVISTQSLSLTVFNDLTFQSRRQDFSCPHLEINPLNRFVRLVSISLTRFQLFPPLHPPGTHFQCHRFNLTNKISIVSTKMTLARWNESDLISISILRFQLFPRQSTWRKRQADHDFNLALKILAVSTRLKSRECRFYQQVSISLSKFQHRVTSISVAKRAREVSYTNFNLAKRFDRLNLQPGVSISLSRFLAIAACKTRQVIMITYTRFQSCY